MHAFRCVLAGAMVAVLGAPISSTAQQEQAGAESAQASDSEQPTRRPPPIIEEIVITAEKRESTIQDTPIAVTGFSARKMDDLGIFGPTEVANFTPGMSYNSGTYSNRINVRGIGRVTNELGADPGVAVYVDGVYTSETAAMGSAPIQVERVEVLRGPQGTLYGRNAMGGAVNILTKRPTHEFEGEARLTVGNYDLFSESLAVSGPVTESLRYRLLLTKTDMDGWIENNSGSDIADTDNFFIEAQVDFDLSEDFNVWLKYSHLEYDQNSGPAWPGLFIDEYDQGSPTYGSLNRNPWIGWTEPNPTARNMHKVDYDYKGSLKLRDNHAITAQVTWDFDRVQLKYVGGYQQYDWTTDVDWDNSSNPDFQYFVFIREKKDWQTHELQMMSTHDGPLQWLLGAYYYNEDIYQPFTQKDPFNSRITRPFLGVDASGAVLPFPIPIQGSNPEGRVYHQEGILESDAWAAFTQVDYDLGERWHLSAGLRYSYDEKEGREHNEWTFDDYQNLLGNNCWNEDFTIPWSSPCAYPTDNGWVEQKEDWDALTFRLGADFRPNDDHLLYASIGSGYKSGGFKLGNLLSVTSCTATFCEPEDVVDEEEVLAYEVGWKATLHERLVLNLAAYYYDYSDFHVPVSVLTPAGIRHTQFVNADEAESMGFEAEATWAVTDNLTLLGIYSYQDTELEKFGQSVQDETDPLFFTDPDAVLPPDGNDLIMSPQFKVTLNGTYALETDLGRWTLGATFSHTDEQYYSIFNDDDRKASAWTRWDYRLSWQDPRTGKLRIIGYLKNATDERIVNGLARADVIHGNMRVAVPGPPRLYGVEIHYTF